MTRLVVYEPPQVEEYDVGAPQQTRSTDRAASRSTAPKACRLPAPSQNQSMATKQAENRLARPGSRP